MFRAVAEAGVHLLFLMPGLRVCSPSKEQSSSDPGDRDSDEEAGGEQKSTRSSSPRGQGEEAVRKQAACLLWIFSPES